MPLERNSRFFGYYPGTVALITAEFAGRRNVMSAGWHAALSSDPPMYGVAVGRERATHGLALASGRFGVNFLPSEHARAVQGAGVLSLHDHVDKFERLGLTALPEAPLALGAAYVAYVCTLEQVVPTGDHDWFVGRVEQVWHDARAFDERLLFRGNAPVYFGRGEYASLAGDAPREVFLPVEFERPS